MCEEEFTVEVSIIFCGIFIVVFNCGWWGTEAVIECWCTDGVSCVVVVIDDGTVSLLDESIWLTKRDFCWDSIWSKLICSSVNDCLE